MNLEHIITAGNPMVEIPINLYSLKTKLTSCNQHLYTATIKIEIFKQHLASYRVNYMHKGKSEEWSLDGSCSSMTEHWHPYGKPKVLGLIPGSSSFLSSPLLFQRSTDSNPQICPN